jgi:hypothetical protein
MEKLLPLPCPSTKLQRVGLEESPSSGRKSFHEPSISCPATDVIVQEILPRDLQRGISIGERIDLKTRMKSFRGPVTAMVGLCQLFPGSFGKRQHGSGRHPRSLATDHASETGHRRLVPWGPACRALQRPGTERQLAILEINEAGNLSTTLRLAAGQSAAPCAPWARAIGAARGDFGLERGSGDRRPGGVMPTTTPVLPRM